MKKLLLAPILAAFLLFGATVPAHAAALTEGQIQAILTLLLSFGVDNAIISSVEGSLRGEPLAAPTITLLARPEVVGVVKSATLSWTTKNARRCVFDDGSVKELIGTNGSKGVSPAKTTTYRLWCANDSGIGPAGPSAEKTVTVAVAAPSCAITPDKSVYRIGETIQFTWTSQNATYALFALDTSGKEFLKVPYEKLDASGVMPVAANVVGNPGVTLKIFNIYGYGTCSASVFVN